MENMDKNEIITPEAIENVVDTTNAEGSALKTIGTVGLVLVAAAAVTRFVFIPVIGKIQRELTKRRTAKRHAENAKYEAEVDVEEIDLDDIPPID